jgi:hypothetical protein
MEHSSTPSFLLLKLNVCIFILLCVPTLYAGARLMNEMSASREDRALPPVYNCCLCSVFHLYVGWLDLNISYVGLVMCRHQRPLFDSAAVRNPALWLARVDAGDLSTHEKGLRKDKASEPTFILLQKLKLEVSDDLKSKFQSLSTVCLIKQP